MGTERQASVKVLLFTQHDDEHTIRAALAARVHGYILKSEPQAELVRALSAMGANRSHFSPVVAEMLCNDEMKSSDHSGLRFTVREIQVAELIAAGRSNKEIARHLAISPKTVGSHRWSLMRKANCHSSSELVRFAIKNRLISAQ